MDQEISIELQLQVTALGSSVGFAFEGTATPVEEIPPPKGSLVWASPFAVIALVPVSHLVPEALLSTSRAAQEWLWRRITLEEKKAKFLDGYVLLALSAQPDDGLRTAVSEVELDTSVCRKHVIWPTLEGSWDHRLWAVTCLGLPRVHGAILQRLAMPTLPGAASRSLKYYDLLKKYEAAADKLIDEATSAAKKNT